MKSSGWGDRKYLSVADERRNHQNILHQNKDIIKKPILIKTFMQA